MKKNASILIILLYSLVNYAQPFLEDFDGTTPPALPPGWTTFEIFGDNGHPCTVVDTWANIDETSFALCLADPVTTSASSAPNFAFIGDVAGAPPGDIVEDVLLTPVLGGLLASETYDIKFKLRRTDKTPAPSTPTVVVKLQYLKDDGDGVPEPGGEDGAFVVISPISLVDGAAEPWTAFMPTWSPPEDGDYFIGWQAEWGEIGETGVCLDDIEISGAPPLPVELSSFSASIIDEGVKLIWVTETEVNNYGFEVERQVSIDQLTAGNWARIGFVEGNGNSNSPTDYSFIDDEVTSGKYAYRLKQIDNDGTFEYSKIIEINVNSPLEFELNQNYPNSFNPSTTIKFSLPTTSSVKLSVFNILGEEVQILMNETKEAGIYTINFNAAELNSGIYFYKLETRNFLRVKKMSLIR